MVAKNKFLVVVATMEGRNFPKRSKYQLVIEARLDGELLATDPVDHVESPDFTQELAWEIDKKGLQQHRMQRTVIKVQCYAVDMLTTAREVIGYVMLDLRSARDKQAGKWYPLLHTKYPKLKPEILLSIYIDEDGTEDTGFKAAEAPARRGHLPPDSSTSEDVSVGYVNLRPILYEDQGYYQLGPEDVCAEFFTLSITVAFAANLTQLIPTSVPLPSSTGGYFFYFTLLGNDVTNESFFDLMNPNFPAERASVRLRSNVDALRSFFKKQPGIQVHLCCGDQSLGNAVIPLDSLLKKESTEIFMKPVSIEGAFELCPPNRWKSQMQPLPESLQPNVGVSVVLRKEIDELAAGNLKIAEETGEKARDQLPVDPTAGTASGGENKSANTADSAPGGALAEATSAPPGGDTDDDLSSMVAEKPLMDDGHQAKATVHLPAHLSVDDSHQVRFKSPMPQEAPLSYTPPHVAVPPHLRRYSFSVELATVRSLDVQHPVNIFLRYVYSFFGSSAPITTHPAVEARGNTQVTLPRSYCAFDFATTAQELKDTFHRIPLVIEVYDRSKQLNKDVLIGVSQLPLAAILDTKRSEAVRGVDGTPAQKLTGTIPILLPEGGGGKLGELDFTLILEDHGAYEPHTIQVPESTTESSETIHVEPAKKAPAPAASPRAPTESLEYRAAVELELWKAAQEKLFEAHLRERESAHMKALSAEWKKRDSERESVFQKRLSEYNMLEKQLKTAVADLNKREGQIKDVESEVTRLKADLQREHDMKLKELQEASKRVKEEADHRVHLERKRRPIRKTVKEQNRKADFPRDLSSNVARDSSRRDRNARRKSLTTKAKSSKLYFGPTYKKRVRGLRSKKNKNTSLSATSFDSVSPSPRARLSLSQHKTTRPSSRYPKYSSVSTTKHRSATPSDSPSEGRRRKKGKLKRPSIHLDGPTDEQLTTPDIEEIVSSATYALSPPEESQRDGTKKKNEKRRKKGQWLYRPSSSDARPDTETYITEDEIDMSSRSIDDRQNEIQVTSKVYRRPGEMLAGKKTPPPTTSRKRKRTIVKDDESGDDDDVKVDLVKENKRGTSSLPRGVEHDGPSAQHIQQSGTFAVKEKSPVKETLSEHMKPRKVKPKGRQMFYQKSSGEETAKEENKLNVAATRQKLQKRDPSKKKGIETKSRVSESEWSVIDDVGEIKMIKKKDSAEGKQKQKQVLSRRKDSRRKSTTTSKMPSRKILTSKVRNLGKMRSSEATLRLKPNANEKPHKGNTNMKNKAHGTAMANQIIRKQGPPETKRIATFPSEREIQESEIRETEGSYKDVEIVRKKRSASKSKKRSRKQQSSEEEKSCSAATTVVASQSNTWETEGLNEDIGMVKEKRFQRKQVSRSKGAERKSKVEPTVLPYSEPSSEDGAFRNSKKIPLSRSDQRRKPKDKPVFLSEKHTDKVRPKSDLPHTKQKDRKEKSFKGKEIGSQAETLVSESETCRSEDTGEEVKRGRKKLLPREQASRSKDVEGKLKDKSKVSSNEKPSSSVRKKNNAKKSASSRTGLGLKSKGESSSLRVKETSNRATAKVKPKTNYPLRKKTTHERHPSEAKRIRSPITSRETLDSENTEENGNYDDVEDNRKADERSRKQGKTKKSLQRLPKESKEDRRKEIEDVTETSKEISDDSGIDENDRECLPTEVAEKKTRESHFKNGQYRKKPSGKHVTAAIKSKKKTKGAEKNRPFKSLRKSPIKQRTLQKKVGRRPPKTVGNNKSKSQKRPPETHEIERKAHTVTNESPSSKVTMQHGSKDSYIPYAARGTGKERHKRARERLPQTRKRSPQSVLPAEQETVESDTGSNISETEDPMVSSPEKVQKLLEPAQSGRGKSGKTIGKGKRRKDERKLSAIKKTPRLERDDGYNDSFQGSSPKHKIKKRPSSDTSSAQHENRKAKRSRNVVSRRSRNRKKGEDECEYVRQKNSSVIPSEASSSGERATPTNKPSRGRRAHRKQKEKTRRIPSKQRSLRTSESDDDRYSLRSAGTVTDKSGSRIRKPQTKRTPTKMLSATDYIHVSEPPPLKTRSALVREKRSRSSAKRKTKDANKRRSPDEQLRMIKVTSPYHISEERSPRLRNREEFLTQREMEQSQLFHEVDKWLILLIDEAKKSPSTEKLPVKSSNFQSSGLLTKLICNAPLLDGQTAYWVKQPLPRPLHSIFLKARGKPFNRKRKKRTMAPTVKYAYEYKTILRNLVQERKAMLDSGNYKDDDKIIADIGQHINKVIERQTT